MRAPFTLTVPSDQIIFFHPSKTGIAALCSTGHGFAICHAPLRKPSPLVSPGAASFLKV
jgi:hypothetical protein